MPPLAPSSLRPLVSVWGGGDSGRKAEQTSGITRTVPTLSRTVTRSENGIRHQAPRGTLGKTRVPQQAGIGERDGRRHEAKH